MQLISMFDLKNFTAQQLTSTVRESKLFSESSILDVLSCTVIQLLEKNEELSEDVKCGRHLNTDLNKNIDKLKDIIKSKAKSNNELNKNNNKLMEIIKSKEETNNQLNKNIDKLKETIKSKEEEVV